jgi:hypothetical protein
VQFLTDRDRRVAQLDLDRFTWLFRVRYGFFDVRGGYFQRKRFNVDGRNVVALRTAPLGVSALVGSTESFLKFVER